MRFHHADAQHGPRVAVVAEIGVNHDGDPVVAERLIGAAAEAGADAVKFQYFDPGRLLSDEAALAGYQEGRARDARDLLEPLRLDVKTLRRLREAAHAAGLAFVVTPFSPEDVADLKAVEPDALKIASPDAVNPLLLEAAGRTGRLVVVSTGTCALEELKLAADIARRSGGALLHCVSAYPTPMDDAALGGIAALRSAFELPTGYSDHTTGVQTGAWAVMAGACVLEKHLTHNAAADGPDHAASLPPEAFAEYVRQVRDAAASLGAVAKRALDVERDVRSVSRQSLAYRRDLPAGHVLTRDDLSTRRPGTGIPAAAVDAVVGRVLLCEASAAALVREDDLATPARA